MRKTPNLAGQRFGKWLVLSMEKELSKEGWKITKAKCKCDCGRVKILYPKTLRDGSSTGCPYCRPYSEERRKRMSETAKKNWLNPSIRERITQSAKLPRRPQPESTKKKIRATLLGRSPSPQAIEKMRRTRQSPEYRLRAKLATMNYMEEWGFLGSTIGRNETHLLDEQEKINKCKILRHYCVKPLGYIVDGYCKETNIVYEVYEPYHRRQKEKDLKRQLKIMKHLNCGFAIIYDRPFEHV